MKNIFPIVLLLLLPISVYPQNEDAKIKAIRDQYTKVKAEIKKIETNEEAAFQSELAVNELVVNKLNKSWPAVGNYSVVYRFYYKQAGEEPYPDHLVFVTIRTTSAAREEYVEILYSDSDDPLFAFRRLETHEEIRMYFKNGKIVEYQGLGKGNKGEEVLYTAATIMKAGDYKKLFQLSIQ